MVEIKFIFTGADLQKVRNLAHFSEPTTVRDVAFFDTAKCQLLDGTLVGSDLKLILRVRLTPGKDRGKTTLKIRTTGTLDASLQTNEAAGAKREFDLAVGRPLLDSYSLDDKQDREEIEAVFAGHRPVKSLFGDAQQAHIESLASKRFRWANLRIFGPVERVQCWEEVAIPGYTPVVTFELWGLPARGRRPLRQILELSTRASLEEYKSSEQRLLQVLEHSGIQPSASETKTKTVMEHFSPGRKTG